MSGNIVRLPEDPYRGIAYDARKETIRAQMVGACEFLLAWEKFRPVIAGGALWSWASQEVARDVDIFCKNSWRTRRLANRGYGVDHRDELQGRIKRTSYDGGGTEDGFVSVHRYSTMLPGDTGTMVDFNLTPWRGAEVVKHFDYQHDCVSFGRTHTSWAICTSGASFYEQEMLVARYDRGRDKSVVRSKFKSLWGDPSAGARLGQVMVNLTHIYKSLKSNR